jgi:hypothetical protein
MKSPLTLLATALLGLGVAACGCSSKHTASQGHANAATGGTSATASSNFSTHKNDRDNDGDNNDDDEHVLDFGHAANAADSQTITALVRHYFAAAAAEDGATACSLLAPFIAESVVENYGRAPALRGKTCAAVMAKLFKHHHQELANKDATLKVIRVGVEGDKSLVALEFPTIPEVRQVTARRNGNAWKLLTLLDGILE